MGVRRYIFNHWPYVIGVGIGTAVWLFPTALQSLFIKSGIDFTKLIEMAFNFLAIIMGFLFFSFSLLLTSVDKFIVKLRNTGRFNELQYLYVMTFVLSLLSILFAFGLIIFQFNIENELGIIWYVFGLWLGFLVITLIYFSKSIRIFYVIIKLPRSSI